MPMDVSEMIVTNADGKTGKDAEDDLVGTICPVLMQDETKDMYHFYAIAQKNAYSLNPVPTDKNPQTVTLMRPVGGKMEGLYRFPHIGEKVLVLSATNGNYYLMGYLPGEETPFSSPVKGKEDSEMPLDKEGLSLRYKKKGENKLLPVNAEDYSEIAFYRDKSAWQQDGAEVDVDKIRVSSTGDVESFAENLNQLNGKRIVLQSKFLYSDKVDQPDGGDKVITAGNIATGTDLEENVLAADDIKKGDVIINADNRIVLNAREGIMLCVGASSIELKPSKVSIDCAKIDGEVSGEGPYDASIALDSRGDVKLYGRKLVGDIQREVNFCDAFGGELSSTMGRVSVSGAAVSVSTNSNLSNIFTCLGAISSAIEQVVSVPLSQEDHAWQQKVNGRTVNQQIEKVLALATKIGAEFEKDASAGPGGPKDTVSKVINLIFKVIEDVRAVLETGLYKKYCAHYNPDTQKWQNRDERFPVTLAFSIVEATYLFLVAEEMLRAGIPAMLHSASLTLSQQANIVLDSKGYYQDSIEEQKCRAVAAGLAAGKKIPAATQQEADAANDAAANAKTTMDNKQAAADTAKQELDTAIANGDPDEIATKRAAYDTAQKELNDAKEDYANKKAYADNRQASANETNKKEEEERREENNAKKELQDARAAEEQLDNNPNATAEQKAAAHARTEKAKQDYANAVNNSVNPAPKPAPSAARKVANTVFSKNGWKWTQEVIKLASFEVRRFSTFMPDGLSDATKAELKEL